MPPLACSATLFCPLQIKVSLPAFAIASGFTAVKMNATEEMQYIDSYDILEFRQTEMALYWKIKVTFVDTSLLFTKEYVSESFRKYSFHWQKIDETLIIRWDNAPHYPQISTHPHHKHVEMEENVLESKERYKKL